jgi:hypothetical protein
MCVNWSFKWMLNNSAWCGFFNSVLLALHHPHGIFEKCKQMQHNSRKTTRFTEQKSGKYHNYEISTYKENRNTYLSLTDTGND